MAIENICFLIQTPLTRRDFERFGVEKLRSRGFSVWFLDFSPLINPDYKAEICVDPVAVGNLIQVRDKQKLNAFLSGMRNNVFIIDMIRRKDVPGFIYGSINGAGIPVAVFCAGSTPEADGNLSGLIRAGLSMLFCPSYMFRKIKGVTSQRPKYKYIIVGAEKDRRFPVGAEKTIRAHTLDYDLYLDYAQKAPLPVVEGEYAVFLDEYFPLHPDFMVYGSIKNPYKNNWKEYYAELNKMLNGIEEKFNVPAVIAAHPRSKYENMPEIFNGRRVIRGETVNLVANSRFCIAHASTSVNFAVIFNKPVIFLMPSRAKRGYYEKNIAIFAKELKKRYFDAVSLHDIDPSKELIVDMSAYGTYKENYIKSKATPERYFWDIVADEIRADYP